MHAIKRYLSRFDAIRRLDVRIRGAKWVPEESLDGPSQLCLPENSRFKALAEEAEKIEGMMSHLSMAAMDMLIEFQESLGAQGDILEIGTYRGKSAVILGGRLRDKERLVLVDIEDYLDPAAIMGRRVDFILTHSENLQKALPEYRARRGTFRFVHIDAGHGYEETFQELAMAEELLGKFGVIALDDFTNLHFSQNIAAIFKYLYTTRTKLMPLVVTDEKAYLCRRRDFNAFAMPLFRTGHAEMRSRGVECVLARTGYNPEYRAFYLRPKTEEDTSSFYAADLYGNQILGR